MNKEGGSYAQVDLSILFQRSAFYRVNESASARIGAVGSQCSRAGPLTDFEMQQLSLFQICCVEVSTDWTYIPKLGGAEPDYVTVRQKVEEQLVKGFFGPPPCGVFSASVQASYLYPPNVMFCSFIFGGFSFQVAISLHNWASK